MVITPLSRPGSSMILQKPQYRDRITGPPETKITLWVTYLQCPQILFNPLGPRPGWKLGEALLSHMGRRWLNNRCCILYNWSLWERRENETVEKANNRRQKFGTLLDFQNSLSVWSSCWPGGKIRKTESLFSWVRPKIKKKNHYS